MEQMTPFMLALLGTLFTCAATMAGAAMVFCFRKEMSPDVHRIFLGFAAGIMIAASIWSLLNPAIEMAEAQGVASFLPATGGFTLGALFLFGLDRLLPHLHIGSNTPEGMRASWKRTTLLVLAVTLHNIPEGIAVGLTFALAAQGGDTPVTMAGAVALAIGMALQNFPEGAAVSLPLKKEGVRNGKAFWYGTVSGLVEPVAGMLGVLLATGLAIVMPWMLSFAAGAMMYVVVEEMIPEAHLGDHSHSGTAGVLSGFLLMMILDVALG